MKASIARYDENGYNDKSVKHNSIECLEQIRDSLGYGDHEGLMAAQVFYGTLMSPITDMIPGDVINYIHKGSGSGTDK